MSSIAIEIEGLAKRYQIGRARPTDTMRDRLAGLAGAPLRMLRRSRSGDTEDTTLWALRDVNLRIDQGEVVGIIGSNGAGKSTLLKVISRITVPTRGSVRIRGRVGTLLEVGTGFHPELTGRENIYLNGAILGMQRREIERKFDEIVEFAETGRFLDTPVKRYSSGMFVRLAFAVAAHLEPEILIVDEVLAVGDAKFQKKCFGAMSDVAQGGRTVVFVSHNMAAVQQLCPRVILLEQGRVAAEGPAREIVSQYLHSGTREAYSLTEPAPTGKAQLLEAYFEDSAGNPLAHLSTSDPFRIVLRYLVPEPSPGLRIGIGFLTNDGLPFLTVNNQDVRLNIPGHPGEYRIQIAMEADMLLAGQFHLATCMWNTREILDWREPALSFTVEAGASRLYATDAQRKGIVHLPSRWSIESLGANS